MGSIFCILRRVAWSFTLVSCQVAAVVVNVKAYATEEYAAATGDEKPTKGIKENSEENDWQAGPFACIGAAIRAGGYNRDCRFIQGRYIDRNDHQDRLQF